MPQSPPKIPVTHDAQASRFEATVDGQRATAEYVRKGDTIIFTHTTVPPALEGRGIGSALARTALDHARAEGLVVVPQCRFMAGFIREHPEYGDLVKG